MECFKKVSEWFCNAKSYLIILSLQFGSAGMYLITMDALNKGMSHYVFVVYRNVIASVALAPFAFFFERKVRPKMTVRIFSEIMAVAFVEIILDQCFTFMGMKYTSASFASAVMNSVPSITFVLAIIFRLERMNLREVGCLAKISGTVITLGGAFLMALYKGPALHFVGSSATNNGQPENVNDPSGNHWLIGACFLLIGCAGFAAFYILQAITLRKYPAEMSLATWICFIGALQSSAVSIFMERNNPHVWSLAWDSRLLAYAYSGIVTSAIQFYVQGMVIKTTGPVFVTAFNPLRMIIVTALACLVLSEKLHLGSIIGGVVVVIGLYLVVWGKAKEQKKKHLMPPSPEKVTLQRQQQLPLTVLKNDGNDNKPQLVIIGDRNHDMEEARAVNTESQQQ
ncbi:unnamed protein product [Sphenostylis stenocarpa]|uniref:WAT1-related protein n=1 Tax=Sphenostylis stenocarpa TaxID=92480 RepID=A0AA86TDL6_9FABA|nr:unnamed protein product [Sphenostylis stenocarpa]